MADLTMGGYFAVIPAPVLYDPYLRPRVKLLYGELMRLAQGTGFCYAKNKFLLDVCTYADAETGAKNAISERTLQSMLAELRDRGHIRMDTGPIPGRCGEIGRRIFIGQTLAPTPSSACAEGGEENCTPRNFLRQRGAENFTPYISPPNTRTNTPIAPKEAEGILRAYAGEDAELWNALAGFLNVRAAKRNPLSTARAAHILTGKLDKLSGGRRDVKIALLDEAALHNWDSVYPLKADELPAAEAGDGEGEIYGI